MKLDKTKNAVRNVFFGSTLKLYTIMVSFVFRAIMIRTLGTEYLGLNGLFTSVLQVLNLAELGVGSAMVFSMYKPVAEDNEAKICALLQLYKKSYRIIGSVILALGLACTPFIPKLINGYVPEGINVYIIFLMHLSVTVLTYWMFAYKLSVLQAYQRQDVISKLALFTSTLMYIFQAISLVVFRNYYYYAISNIISQVMNNILTAAAVKKYYPGLCARGKLDQTEVSAVNQRIKDLFTSKFGGIIVTSFDTIVISAFLGLEMLAKYQNYYFIISSIITFIAVVNTSVVAGVGNSMLMNSYKENYKEFKVFSFMELWIIGFCVCCFSSLFQPFMKLWMGEAILLPYTIVVLLCIMFAGNQLIQMFSVYKDAGGIWHKDKYRPLISGLMNLIVNLILVNFLGLFGVVLSTIISIFFISLPWIIKNVFTLIFDVRDLKQYIGDLLIWLITIVASAILTNALCFLIKDEGMGSFAAKALIALLLPNLFYLMLFHKRYEYRKCKSLVIKTLHINTNTHN